MLKEHIPAELHDYRQWVCWRYVQRGKDRKPDKRPLNPHNLHNAGVNWPNTWSTFEHACSVYWANRLSGVSGVGFVLTHSDSIVGVDMDSCLIDGELSQHAGEVIDRLQSYTEISPSGTGVRILVSYPEYTRNVRQPSLELYSHSRFLTLTGRHLEGTLEMITSTTATVLNALVADRHTDTRVPVEKRMAPLSEEIGDSELWQRIFSHDRYGEQHLRRYSGDTSLDGGDHSLTVIRLLNCLAHWTQGDASRMRTLMLMSPLANEKWLTKRGASDWLDYQIQDAIRYENRSRTMRDP